MVHKFLPKQSSLNQVINLIESKILKETHLPIIVKENNIILKEMHAGYLTSTYLKNIYSYLIHNKLPSSRAAIGRNTGRKNIDYILDRYHNSLLEAHQGYIRIF